MGCPNRVLNRGIEMKDVRIYHAWIGEMLMGVGLTEDQAVEHALKSGEESDSWGDDGRERGAFGSKEEYLDALDVSSDWLSDCDLTILSLLETREVEDD